MFVPKAIFELIRFLEGCYHAYTPHSAPYPGVVVSTGTEDYFDSAAACYNRLPAIPDRKGRMPGEDVR